MSIVAIDADCVCGGINRSDLRQCPIHFHLWNGDQRLASVGSIIRMCWPPPASPPPESVLENARERGAELDKLAAAYVRGTLTKIPAGTRHDARDLFYKFVKWFDRQNFKTVEAQIVLGNDVYGGVLDFRFDGMPVDLKGTYNVEQTARMQVAGYMDLLSHRGDILYGHILHITERLPEPRLVDVLEADLNDWRIMLAHWRMLQRRVKP